LEACGETLTARTKNITDLGFKKVLHLNEEIIDNKKFQQIMKGKIFTIKQVHSVEKFTEPPQRLTEADILGQMEKYGLGTPATRAEIIEKLVSSESVERKHGRFYSTQKGKQLIDLVNEELKSPKLTAKWEKELELIARGKAKPEVFLKKIRQKTKALVAEIKQSDKTYRTPNLTGSKCPDCGSFLKEKNTRDGKILICSNLECSYKRRKDPKLSNRRCPQCHKRMEIHQGVAGAYFQCRRCNIVEKAEEKQKLVNKREERKLIQKYTKKDNTFGTSLGDLLKAVLQEKE
jgi:DNA topoisomerase III